MYLPSRISRISTFWLPTRMWIWLRMSCYAKLSEFLVYVRMQEWYMRDWCPMRDSQPSCSLFLPEGTADSFNYIEWSSKELYLIYSRCRVISETRTLHVAPSVRPIQIVLMTDHHVSPKNALTHASPVYVVLTLIAKYEATHQFVAAPEIWPEIPSCVVVPLNQVHSLHWQTKFGLRIIQGNFLHLSFNYA